MCFNFIPEIDLKLALKLFYFKLNFRELILYTFESLNSSEEL